MNYMQVYKLYTCKYCMQITYTVYIVVLTMIKTHVFHTTSQYLVIIWITGLKILTGDITHINIKNYYFPLENIIRVPFMGLWGR
jgi:hypothetical protein